MTGKNVKKKLNNIPYEGCDIYVFRFRFDLTTKQWVLENSKQCRDCTILIKKAKIRRVYYSVGGETPGLVCINAKKLETNHVSIGRRI